MPKLTFGELLKQFREGAGLTQDELAVGLGIDRSRISRLEGGKGEGNGNAVPRGSQST